MIVLNFSSMSGILTIKLVFYYKGNYMKKSTGILVTSIITFFLMIFVIIQLLFSTDNFESEEKKITELNSDIANIVNNPMFYQSFWGLQIQNLSTGKIYFSKNSEKLFVPASILKLVTAAVSLEHLGHDFQFKTYIYYTGQIVNNTLHGDLIVSGGGDPTIAFRDYKPDCLELFYKWAKILKRKGIKKIDGDIIGFDRVFDKDLIGPGRIYEDLSYWFSPEISGLQFNENTVNINVSGGKSVGDKVYYSYTPKLDYVNFINQATTSSPNRKGNKELWFERSPKSNKIYIKGKIAVGEYLSERVAIHNPRKFFVKALKTALQRRNIYITGLAKDSIDDNIEIDKQKLKLLHTHYSKHLSLIINRMLKWSNNLYAETLFKYLGFHNYKSGSFWFGKKAINMQLSKWGISGREHVIRDGSGLTRYNFVSPNSMTKLLKAAHKAKWKNVFFNSLPVAGMDGTLRKRMKETSASNMVFAKTGYLSGVYSLCGYAKTKNDEEIAFTILINNFNLDTKSISYTQDLICERLVNFSK